MTHAIGDKVTMPDGRRAIVLDRERVRVHGHTLVAYAVRFFNESVRDDHTHAEYVPEAMMVNSMRLQ